MDSKQASSRRQCAAPPAPGRTALRLACVFEQAIGHITFQKNLSAQMAGWPDVQPTWHPLSFTHSHRWPARRLNWTLRAGLQAREALRGQTYDALLFHTHLPALLCPDIMGRAPTLLSVDATPAQNARLGIYVGGAQRQSVTRYLASRWTAWGMEHAYRVVAWSDWVRQSLITEYGLRSEQIEVLSPGINVRLWREACAVARNRPRGHLPRILFVGGDLYGKGGELLLQCFRERWVGRAELHLVTRTTLPEEPGVFVHNGLTPNSEALLRLFREADLFVLPTLGDAFPHVVMEAMASDLPVVASAVGAIPEMVSPGETGFLVPRGQKEDLFAAVEALVQDPTLRLQMGKAGGERVSEHYDIARNGRRLVELLHRAREERA